MQFGWGELAPSRAGKRTDWHGTDGRRPKRASGALIGKSGGAVWSVFGAGAPTDEGELERSRDEAVQAALDTLERLETLVDEGLRARPDVAAKIAQLRAQDLTNKATEGRYGPAVAATHHFS